MITRDKKAILLVEPSKVLSKLIKKQLEQNDFEVFLCDKGLDALKEVIKIQPDCIIADKELPQIDGFQLCSIVKNGTEFYSTPFILVSAEDYISDFWADTKEANAEFSLSADNIPQLITLVQSFINNQNIELSFFTEDDQQNKEFDTNDYTLCAVKAMDKSSFFYNMMKEIFNLNSYIEDLDEFLEHMLWLLKSICTYDAATIIIADKISTVYYTGLENMSEEAGEDFLNICRTDFEHMSHNENGNIYNHIMMPGFVDEPLETNSFASYINIPIETNDIIGSIHLASRKNHFFTYKIRSSIQFFAEKVNYMLQESVLHRRVTMSERKLRNIFSKFVPEEIIEDLLANEDNSSENLSNEKRKVAIMICDIRNFTSISEINQPENVVTFLNSYFSRMVDIIKSHGGSIDKFIGDAIMALFGAPISYVDNAQRAAEAALEMIATLPEIDTSLLEFPEGMSFDIGVGIHQGEVIVGNIGSKDKTNYTVIGDSVNLASRVEGLTKRYGSRIVVTQAVQEELNNEINCYLLDKVKVKGKNQGVQIYSICDKPLPKDFEENYEKGLNLYMSGAFKLAQTYFERAEEFMPGDKAVVLLKARCEEFIKNPPENWNGAIALTHK